VEEVRSHGRRPRLGLHADPVMQQQVQQVLAVQQAHRSQCGSAGGMLVNGGRKGRGGDQKGLSGPGAQASAAQFIDHALEEGQRLNCLARMMTRRCPRPAGSAA